MLEDGFAIIIYLAKKITYTSLIIAGVFLIILASFGLNAYMTRKKLDNAYARIKIGDSRESVVALMGKPDRIESCDVGSKPKRNENMEEKRYREQCVEEYWYDTFLHPYGIAFDKQNSVLAKGYQVSPPILFDGEKFESPAFDRAEVKQEIVSVTEHIENAHGRQTRSTNSHETPLNCPVRLRMIR